MDVCILGSFMQVQPVVHVRPVVYRLLPSSPVSWPTVEVKLQA